MINNVVVISDLHCGCQVGLCPPEGMKLDGGNTVQPNATQLAIWEAWTGFWDEWVPSVTRGEPFAVVVNGDAIDGSHHRSTHQISHNIEDQVKLAEKVLAPVRDRCAAMYAIRGTEAHVGQSSRDEEELFRSLGAEQDQLGNFTRYDLWLTVGACHCHFAHHIGTTGSMAYETSAVMKELTELFSDSARWEERHPDMAVRSHRHRHVEVRVPTASRYAYAFVTAAWQGKTPFAYRIPGGRIMQPHIGGSVIRQGDEEFYTRHFTRTLRRSETVVLGG